jgi:hypothetical protein
VTVRDDWSDGDGDDPFTGVVFDDSFVLGARTREPSNAERQQAAKIISLEAERARRRTPADPTSQTYLQWLFEDVHVPRILQLPSPQLVAVIGAVALAALLLGERLSPAQSAGVAAALGGIVLIAL